MALVRYTPGRPTVKTAISVDKPLLERIDRAARAMGIPRSQLLATAAQELLDRQDNARLLALLNEAHAAGSTRDEVEQRRQMRRRQRRRVEGEW